MKIVFIMTKVKHQKTTILENKNPIYDEVPGLLIFFLEKIGLVMEALNECWNSENKRELQKTCEFLVRMMNLVKTVGKRTQQQGYNLKKTRIYCFKRIVSNLVNRKILNY